MYLLREKGTHDRYLLKVISRSYNDMDTGLLRQISHPGIVSIVDFGTTEHYIYVIKEYIKGITLKSHISEKGCLSYVHLRAILPGGERIHNQVYATDTSVREADDIFIWQQLEPEFEVPARQKVLTVHYPEKSIVNEYSFDNENWLPYTEPLIIDRNCYVYNRAVMPDGKIVTGGVEFSNIIEDIGE